MATTVSVGSIAPVLVTTAGSVNDRLTVTFPSAPRSTGTIYYGTTAKVSSSNNTGSLAPGATLTMDRQQFYFIAALDANGKNASGLISYFPPVNEEQPLIPGALVRLNGSAIETSTDHGTTWIAAQTPGPTTTIYQSVDSLSVNPRSVTDWGPLINTAVAGGAKRFVFGPFEYPFSTQLAMNETYGIIFEGAGGALHPAVSDRANSSLVWKGGAGSGIAITASGSDGFTIRDMGVYYDNNAYNSDLIFLGFSTTQTGTTTIDGCQLGTYLRTSANAGSGAAHSLINAQNMVGGRIMRSSFRGAQFAIYGATTATGFTSGIDDNKFLMNTFESATSAYFCNIGTFWKIHYNTFYGGLFGNYATPQIIGYDATGTNQSNFNFSYNEIWDGSPPITQNVNNPWIAEICANRFWDGVFPQLAFNGPSRHLVVSDNWFQQHTLLSGGSSVIDLGSSTTAYKEYARIKGNALASSGTGSTWPEAVGNMAGHGYLEVDASINIGVGAAVSEIVQTVGRERVRKEDALGGVTQAVASAGNAANVSGVTLTGNDSAGIIEIDIGSGITAGAVVDVTFSKPIPRGFAGNPAFSGAHEVPSVQLTPIMINTSNIAVAQDAKAYPKHTAGPVNTGWVLAFRAAPGVTTSVAFSYRVIQT